MNDQANEFDVEVQTPMDINASVALARVEIDMQISTARAYPRLVSRVHQKMLDFVQLTKESASECMYALPIEGGKSVTGPSIRFAEALLQAWGNAEAGSRPTEVNRLEGYVEAEGVFLDRESNIRRVIRTRRSIRDKHGKLYKERMIVVASSAAASIAVREAILRGIPRAIWNASYDAVIETIKGDVKTLVERRDRAVKAFAVYGVSPERVFARLEVGGIDDIGVDDLPELFAMYQSIKNGESTVEEYFPPEQGKAFNPMADKEFASPAATANQSGGDSGEGAGPEGSSSSGESGSAPSTKRHRRTKAEMEAARAADTDTQDGDSDQPKGNEPSDTEKPSDMKESSDGARNPVEVGRGAQSAESRNEAARSPGTVPTSPNKVSSEDAPSSSEGKSDAAQNAPQPSGEAQKEAGAGSSVAPASPSPSDAPPTDPKAYCDYARAWIDAETSESVINERWAQERSHRSKIPNITSEMADELTKYKKARVAEIRGEQS